MTTIKDRAAALSEQTATSYSWDRYSNWTAVCAMLLRRGFTEREAEAILRSKWTRWAGDGSTNAYGHCTSKDLARFLDGMRNLDAEVRKLVTETFPE
jgi:hypothetical protein